MITRTYNRYRIYFAFIKTYLAVSTLVRLILYILSVKNIGFSLPGILKIFGLGFIFDLGTALFFTLFYLLYLLFFPKRFTGSMVDKILTWVILFLTTLIATFAFFAEFPFWDEFNTRFNFIAVDYLIYTYEVIENINQSYPLPFLIAGMVLIVCLFFFVLHKRKIFSAAFADKQPFFKRGAVTVIIVLITLPYIFWIKNKHAEWSSNIYENELSKNGVYSFFAAYKSNELDYETFYPLLEQAGAMQILKKELIQPNQSFTNPADIFSIERKTTDTSAELHPNIVLICMESMSGDYMKRLGNTQQITPNLDRIATESIFFDSIYATGTRTVRGMEALTLCVPPTPGNSIVRRPDNDNIFSIADIFRGKNYTNYFIYGGDGYFDNMNTFFGGQGFTIVDRNRGNPLSDNIKTERINIADNEVKFENAWGISDEDIFSKTITLQDKNFSQNKLGFYYIMTTSNHKPYTFPSGKIDLPQGTRESAVKYADFAIGDYLRKAQTKAWFRNTIFIIVADHCASSAGKWDINVSQHHIPAMIYNLENHKDSIRKVVSQIDIMPTVFGLLHWNYTTSLFGKDVYQMQPSEGRALIGNYRTLGLLSKNNFIQINDRKQVRQFAVTPTEMRPTDNIDEGLREKTIAYYQMASYRFKHKLMKNKK